MPQEGYIASGRGLVGAKLYLEMKKVGQKSPLRVICNSRKFIDLPKIPTGPEECKVTVLLCPIFQRYGVDHENRNCHFRQNVRYTLCPHFGRTENFIIFDTITKGWDVYPNPALNARGNIGVQAAEFIANHDVQVAISGDFGPNAAKVMARAGIHMFSAALTIRKVLADYDEGQLREVVPPSRNESQPREILPDPAWEGY